MSSGINPQRASHDLIGTRIFGQYEIVRKLGEGGMGAVYQARQEAIDQDVAIKVLLAEAAKSQEIVQRFHREAKVISMLTHPNIIRVFIFGRMPNGAFYLAMEFVKGRELREDLRGRPLDELVAIRIMKQCCSALAEAHDLGIVHRDLKPDNVLLTNFRGDNNFVKILDFGIAKLTDNSSANDAKLTQAGIVYGTPEYLSPEQAQAFDLDNRTDIYSLGVMLYEMMTGRVPFQGDSPVKILTKHVFEEPMSPNEVMGGTIAPTMENIILKAMRKDREERFTTALDMFKALVHREQEILRSKGMGADANYIPGGELTGMFQAVTAPPTGPPPGPAMGRPPARPSFPTAPAAPAYRDETSAMRRDDMLPAPAQAPDNARKLILAVIGMGVLVLLGLIGLIVVLLLDKG